MAEQGLLSIESMWVLGCLEPTPHRYAFGRRVGRAHDLLPLQQLDHYHALTSLHLC